MSCLFTNAVLRYRSRDSWQVRLKDKQVKEQEQWQTSLTMRQAGAGFSKWKHHHIVCSSVRTGPHSSMCTGARASTSRPLTKSLATGFRAYTHLSWSLGLPMKSICHGVGRASMSQTSKWNTPMVQG